MGVVRRLKEAAAKGVEFTRDQLKAFADHVMMTRRRAFKRTFNRELYHVQIVLQALADQSYLFKTTFHTNADAQKHFEGRRWMMLFILDHLDMSKEEFLAKYRRKDLE